MNVRTNLFILKGKFSNFNQRMKRIILKNNPSSFPLFYLDISLDTKTNIVVILLSLQSRTNKIKTAFLCTFEFLYSH